MISTSLRSTPAQLLTMAGLLPLLLPLLLAVSASAQVFLSIDCGASEPYTDRNGIKWVGDGSYVKAGQAHSVENTTSLSRELATLRAFTSRKKNCYTIPVKGGGQILLRVSIYYGNYDGKASPPEFDLMFDGNEWGTVGTTMEDVFSYEAIYVVDGEATSVCFAQTKPGQFPFVSAIEARSLDQNMYPNFDSKRWLLMWDRVAFGAASDIRYPDDPYDRIWTQGEVKGLAVLKNESVIVVSDATDKPPVAAFRAAIGTNSTSQAIPLTTSLPLESTDININLYFAEMLQLSLTDRRSVEVTADGALISESMAVPVGDVLEFRINSWTANASTSITVQAATDSTLPPIISAMEVFSVGPERRATDTGDVADLASLKQLWPVLNDWTGDPCLPTRYNWEWVGCSSDDAPRITALYLSGFGLSGELPLVSSLALTALERIDLHNNSLSGPIPSYLANLPSLKELNLADNNFNGTVPSSLSQNSNLKLDVSGNPNLQCNSGGSCSSGGSSAGSRTTTASPGKKKKSSNTGIIVGITVPLVVIFCAAVGLVVYFHQKRTAAALAATSGKPNGYGVPGGPPSHPTPSVPAAAGGEGTPATEDRRIEIERQMGSELADLMAQQAQQQYETVRSPEMAPESTLLRQQQA